MCNVILSNVSFAYNEQVVLNQLSLAIPAGEFVAVVGPNGAGKSTMLKTIAGLIRPSEGEVLIDGKMAGDKKLRGLVAYVPQNYSKNLHGFPATVKEVVCLGLAAASGGKKYTAQGMRHIVAHLLDLVGMGTCLDTRIGGLSGGQQQRVMVAMALASNPQLLLLDEPTSGIDYEASTKIYELLGNLNKTLGITVVMVSHDMDKAVHWASKVACINKGVCFFGDSSDFKASHAQAPHLWYYGR